jgi:hypothetical protein
VRASGAAILGAAVVAIAFAASTAKAAEPDRDVDFDVDAEIQLAMNYYANALTNPIAWSDGQLKSLEGLLVELGFSSPEATNIADMRIGLYGDTMAPPEPLPDINFIPASTIDAIADQAEADQAALDAAQGNG